MMVVVVGGLMPRVFDQGSSAYYLLAREIQFFWAAVCVSTVFSRHRSSMPRVVS